MGARAMGVLPVWSVQGFWRASLLNAQGTRRERYAVRGIASLYQRESMPVTLSQPAGSCSTSSQ